MDGAGKTITFRNSPKARFEMDLEVTGQVKDLCDSGGTTMSAMRLAYNGHRHRENGQEVIPTNLIKRWRHDGTVADGER